MATVQKWGNSLAIRIPTAIAAQIEVSEGAVVDFEVRDGRLVVHPVKRNSVRLEDLLKDCKPSQLHGEVDFGEDVGREVIARIEALLIHPDA